MGVDPETSESLWWKNTFAKDGTWTGREITNLWPEADYYATEETTVLKWQGGFGASVKFYGFDFSVNCSYQLGGKGIVTADTISTRSC